MIRLKYTINFLIIEDKNDFQKIKGFFPNDRKVAKIDFFC